MIIIAAEVVPCVSFGLRLAPIAVLSAAVLLAGCLGSVPEPPEPPDPAAPATAASDASNESVEVRGDEEWLAPWLQDVGEVLREPDLSRLGEYAYNATGFGALRLLGDGRAFVLVVDAGLDALPEGVVALARIHDAEHGQAIVRGGGAVDETGQTVIELPSHGIFRFTNSYAFEVLLVRPDEDVSVEDEEQLLGMVREAQAAGGSMNLTWVQQWSGPLKVRPTWSLGFDGPGEGVDRPDVLEDLSPDGPALGTYRLTLKGEWIWVANILMVFDRSVVADTDPPSKSNGTNQVSFQLDGARPLEAFLDKMPDRGMGQGFEMEVQIDYENEDDLPGEVLQRFELHADLGYRFGGNTYVAGSDARTIEVLVENRIP